MQPLHGFCANHGSRTGAASTTDYHAADDTTTDNYAADDDTTDNTADDNTADDNTTDNDADDNDADYYDNDTIYSGNNKILYGEFPR